jgi:hypothetical protein
VLNVGKKQQSTTKMYFAKSACLDSSKQTSYTDSRYQGLFVSKR